MALYILTSFNLKQRVYSLRDITKLNNTSSIIQYIACVNCINTKYRFRLMKVLLRVAKFYLFAILYNIPCDRFSISPDLSFTTRAGYGFS